MYVLWENEGDGSGWHKVGTYDTHSEAQEDMRDYLLANEADKEIGAYNPYLDYKIKSA